jgi:hypothetical protein
VHVLSTGSLLPGVGVVKYSYETCSLEDLWRLLAEEVMLIFPTSIETKLFALVSLRNLSQSFISL